MSFPALAARTKLARQHPLTDACLVAASLLPLLSSPAATGDERIPCAQADCWRGEDPALAVYCRPARPYTPLLEPRSP